MTRHTRASYVEATFELADMTSSESKAHKDIRPTKVIATEKDVVKILDSFSNFINPFEVDNKDVLFCISSGAPATKDIQDDLLRTDEVGQNALSKFIKERLVEKNVSFHSPLSRQNLRTFAALKKKKQLTSTQKKVLEIKAERNLFGQLVLLSEEHNISIDKTLSYPLGPVSWTLATADGSPMKTDKAKLLHSLEADITLSEKPNDRDVIYIYDGNALLQAITGLPDTFEELAEKILDGFPKVERLDFVTDTYKEDSIKSAERKRRGSS